VPDVSAADFDVAFLEGFAQLLAAIPNPVGTWKTSGAYTASETGIMLGVLPQSPDRVISLATYGVDDDPTLSDSIQGLQVTTREAGQDPRANARLTGLVFNRLHGLDQVELPSGVHVVSCFRRSWTSIGQDANNRHRTTQNFYVTVHRPSANRT
jgi:hypothetical protein